MGAGEVALIGVARGHRKGDAAHAGAHQRADPDLVRSAGIVLLHRTRHPQQIPIPVPLLLQNPNANNPGAPAAGANSFTEAQAKSRIEAAGYSNVSGLTKDKDGIWRAKAFKPSTTVGSTTLGSTTVDVALDYQGKVVSKRPTENELSDFSRLWHDGCVKAIIEAQNVDQNHSAKV